MKKRFRIIFFLAAGAALLAMVACGSSATAPVPTQPTPTERPLKGNPPPAEPKAIETLAPIEDTTVVAPAEPGGGYILKITSGLPNGCARFKGYEVERDSNRFVVEVTNLMPDPSEAVACTEIYRLHQGEVLLGSGLKVGEVYTVSVNDDWDVSFTAQDASGLAMIEKKSPIEKIEVVKTDGGYLLTVISSLTKGSSCSRSNGYEINRRFAEQIEVTVMHIEVPEGYLLPCTADLPSVVTEIPLGSDFSEGQTYKIVVNGTETTFPTVVDTQAGDSGSNDDSADGDSGSNEDAASGTPDPVEHATVVVRAPIEGSSVAPSETVGGPYILTITSGLPSGCARFNVYHLSVGGNDYSVEVTNRMPSPDEPVVCTMIYGYHEGQVTLGDGPLVSGETYTVTINGELAHTFTAR